MKNKLTSKQKVSESKGIVKLLIPSFLSIVFFMFFLTGTTWAYFVASIPSTKHKIEAANYDIKVEMSLVESDSSIPILEENGTYYLEMNKTYSVTLTSQGSASTGYCIMQLQIDGSTTSNKYYTNQIARDGSMTFYLKSDQNAYCSFVPSWGTYTGTCDVSNGDTFQISLTT